MKGTQNGVPLRLFYSITYIFPLMHTVQKSIPVPYAEKCPGDHDSCDQHPDNRIILHPCKP